MGPRWRKKEIEVKVVVVVVVVVVVFDFVQFSRLINFAGQRQNTAKYVASGKLTIPVTNRKFRMCWFSINKGS